MYADVLGEMENAGADLSKLPYDVVTEKQSMEHAQERLYAELEGEIADLPRRDAWSGKDLDTAKREMLAGQGVNYKSSQWEKAYQIVDAGVGSDLYLEYKDRLSALKGRGMTSDANAAVRKELMGDSRLTTAQKSTLDDTLLSDTVIILKDVNTDY